MYNIIQIKSLGVDKVTRKDAQILLGVGKKVCKVKKLKSRELKQHFIEEFQPAAGDLD